MFGIRPRLFIAFGGMFVILLTLCLFASAVFNHSTHAIRRTVTDDLDSVIAARDMHDAVDAIEESAYRAMRTGGTLFPARLVSAYSTFDRALALQFQRLNLPGEEAQTAEIQAHWKQIQRAIATIQSSPDAAERARIIQDDLLPAISQTRPLLTDLAASNTQSIKGSHGAVEATVDRARWAMRAITLIGLVVAAGFATIMARRIVRPLTLITTSAVAIARGELDQRIQVRSGDEIGKLADAFNRMTRELRRFRSLDADKLQRSCRTTQAAIDSLPDAVALLDENGRVELANQTAERLFNITAGQHMVPERFPWLAGAVPRPDAPFESYRSTIEIDDAGTRRYFLPQVVTLHCNDNNGDGGDDVGRRGSGGAARVIGATLILTDVTDFHRLDQMKDSLLSMASHELKTPLQCLCVVLPLMLDRRTGPLNDDQRDLVTAARDASERMRNIVQQILDLGRLKSGKIPLQLEPTPAADVIAPALAELSRAFEEKSVDLRLDLNPGLPAVQCDPDKITHVLTNLLNNALRFTPRGGHVTLSAAHRADFVTFTIADTGCGIEPAHLPRIFETFYRVPGQPSDTGTGLGLALVKQIVESHGGSVAVESTFHHGATFSFTLPVAVREAMPETLSNTDTVSPAAKSLDRNDVRTPTRASRDYFALAEESTTEMTTEVHP